MAAVNIAVETHRRAVTIPVLVRLSKMPLQLCPLFRLKSNWTFHTVSG